MAQRAADAAAAAAVGDMQDVAYDVQEPDLLQASVTLAIQTKDLPPETWDLFREFVLAK